MNVTNTKGYILESIRKNKPNGNFAYPEIPAFPKKQNPILDDFKENLALGAGTCHHVKDETEAKELIKQLFPDAKVVCSASADIKGNKDLERIYDPHDLNDVDVGIIRAEFGVAETGMVWLTEKNLGIISLGFLSQHLVILLKPENLVRDMYEAYAHIYLNRDNYGCFMLGPSATADIGAFMVRGAQGARSLTVFFM